MNLGTKLTQRCRRITQRIIEAIGSVGPEDAEQAVERVLAQLAAATAQREELLLAVVQAIEAKPPLAAADPFHGKLYMQLALLAGVAAKVAIARAQSGQPKKLTTHDDLRAAGVENHDVGRTCFHCGGDVPSGFKHEHADGACKQSGQPSRDWPEDAAHENGQYQCICATCEASFVGHKRRVWCKACDKGPVGINGQRDPDFPCDMFRNGEPSERNTCEGDGHYLCNECGHYRCDPPAQSGQPAQRDDNAVDLSAAPATPEQLLASAKGVALNNLRRAIAAERDDAATTRADGLAAELAKAKRALEGAGWVDNGGEAWKPPLGPSPSPLLGTIDALRTELAAAQAKLAQVRSLAAETVSAISEVLPDEPLDELTPIFQLETKRHHWEYVVDCRDRLAIAAAEQGGA